MLRLFLNSFWNEVVWLPPNTTWADLAPSPDKVVTYTDHRHIFLPIPMAMVFLALRLVLEKYVFAPFGRSLGIKDGKDKKPSVNPKLEAAYRANSASKKFVALAKQTDMTQRQVERWWRLRRLQDKPSTLIKFCESTWKCTYYACNLIFGTAVLWNKKWLWDIDHAYIGYPHQGLTNDVWWYFMTSLMFYWSLMISQFRDVRRKDFWQTFVHHLATIALMSFGWVCNLYRIGTLLVLSHECSELFLEAAKASKYAGYQKFCDCLFVAFTLLWIVTRLGYYPFYIIWSALIRAPMLLSMFPAIYMFSFLLCLLMALHMVWTWVILQIAYKAIKAGQTKGDIRSSNSELSASSHYSDHSTTSRPNNKKPVKWESHSRTEGSVQTQTPRAQPGTAAARRRAQDCMS